MRVDILSLFPGYFKSPLDESMLKRAQQRGLIAIHLGDIRDFAQGNHRQVDDRPYGGGPGMVLMAAPVTAALRQAKEKSSKSRTVYLSPQGRPLTAQLARELANEQHLILLCGHYEGIDQRVVDREVDEEISIGDYVLTNGCLAAIVLLDAMVRFIPGVLGHEEASNQDSFEQGLLDCPHYTRPLEFAGCAVPAVLQEGNHEAIRQWRLAQAVAKTEANRPDLYQRYRLHHSGGGEREKGARPPKLRQIGLKVANLPKSRRFYRDLLRLPIVEESQDSVSFSLLDVKLQLTAGVSSGGCAFQLTAEGQEQMQLLAKRVIKAEIGSFEASHQGITCVWFTDLDENLWSVVDLRIGDRKNEQT